jgi:plasmid maintenance system antidote protein VapI
MKETIVDQLRKAIEKCPETEYAIGKGAGVEPATVYRFVSGERGVTLEVAAKLCSYLGLRLVRGR